MEKNRNLLFRRISSTEKAQIVSTKFYVENYPPYKKGVSDGNFYSGASERYN